MISPIPDFSRRWVSPLRWAHAAWSLCPFFWRTQWLPFVPLRVTFPELIHSCLHYSQLWSDERRKKKTKCFYLRVNFESISGGGDARCCLAGMSALLERRPAEEWGSVTAWRTHCCTWSSLLWGAVKLIVRFVIFVFWGTKKKKIQVFRVHQDCKGTGAF